MKGRAHKLNLHPDFDPLNPAHVSDPACWLSPEMADACYDQLRAHMRGLPAPKVWVEPETGVLFADEADLQVDGEPVLYCQPATAHQPQHRFYAPPQSPADALRGYSEVKPPPKRKA